MIYLTMIKKERVETLKRFLKAIFAVLPITKICEAVIAYLERKGQT